MRKARIVFAGLLIVAMVQLGLAQMHEQVDLDAIYKIKQEGLQRSQVMEIMSYLTDVHGPRLTGSPNSWAAGEWTKEKLTEWGMENVHFETWDFGRGWSNQRFVAHVVSPTSYPLIGYPLAWTPGTDGPVRAEVVFAPLSSPEAFDKYKEEHQGKLKGKIVLTSPLRPVQALWNAPAHRLTDKELAQRAEQPIRAARRRPPDFARRFRAFRRFRREGAKFFKDEGVVAILEAGRGTGGTVFVGGGGSRNPEDPVGIPRIALAVEHYGRIVRTVQKDIAVTVELDVQNQFHDKNTDSFNVVAEIPGTDKADELVMLGAHFDSWHAGTGATDNGAGSAVMLEALRILKATGLTLRRTVRIGLWTGEEQGLLGSHAYVKEHFADRTDMKLKADHSKFAAYFNVDNGTGKIRGVYLQGNEAVAPIFRSWMKPFHNMGMATLAIRNTGGTDHLAFDAVGLPGFQFIQDPVEYRSRTHHSNMDVYERIQEEDMKQMAVIVASFVYHAANREEKLPRKPLPKPRGRNASPF